MKSFTYERATSPAEAAAAAARMQGAKFIAGGTNLLDLMKLEIEAPSHLIDVNALALKLQRDQMAKEIGERRPRRRLLREKLGGAARCCETNSTEAIRSFGGPTPGC